MFTLFHILFAPPFSSHRDLPFFSPMKQNYFIHICIWKTYVRLIENLTVNAQALGGRVHASSCMSFHFSIFIKIRVSIWRGVLSFDIYMVDDGRASYSTNGHGTVVVTWIVCFKHATWRLYLLNARDMWCSSISTF